MANNRTRLQKLTNVIIGTTQGTPLSAPSKSVTYNIAPSSEVLFSTNNKEERDFKLKQMKQQRLMAYQWAKTGYETSMEQMAGATQVKVMYRDADLMAAWPEIGSALDTVAEEATTINSKGKILNIYSKSERIKSVLEDLFINRLDFNIWGKTIVRATAKYGNEFMFLNIDPQNGVIGWRELPVHEMTRVENGMVNAYAGTVSYIADANKIKPDDVRFVWEGHNQQIAYKNWQVAHFRLINDSIYLPYGCIVGDSRIETETGYKEISNIKIGDKVVTFNIEQQKKEIAEVTMAMNKGKKEVYNLSTRHNSINATNDHKFLCYENNSLIYKELKDIKIGDLIIVDNSNEKQNNLVKIDKSYPTEKECNLEKSMKWWEDYINFIPDYVDAEFAEFLGFMIGDGWITRDKEIYFALGEYDTFNVKYSHYLEKISGKTIKYIRPNRKLSKMEFIQALVNSKSLSIILKRMGFNGNFNEKRVPEWIFSCNDEIKRAFLHGLMVADGSYNIDKYNCLRCQIEMANEQLIKDIKTLVQSLGLKSSNVKNRNRIGKVSELKCGYKIIVKNETFYFYFYDSLNNQEIKYDLKNRLNEGFKTEKVISISYIGEKETYDITVSNNNSNFFANGIVTHNCSWLNKARRHWRMLSMMEDGMLLYRLERSIERRVFKVNVGLIDDDDVPAFLQEFMNNVKRAPIIDPQTGQIDLRKNFLDVSADYVIPVRNGQDPTSIDNLPPAQNQTSMEDIQYIENKVLCALRVPKTYLNFQEPQGKGQNLSIMDIRFCRTINGIQQAILMELNKIAIIHLYLLGFEDDLTNFTLSLNNPSNQIEMMELDNLTKRLAAATTALAEQGGGIPLMSWHQVQKEIMGRTDSEIADLLNEIRLENAIAVEIQRTAEIIKQTHLFDKVDRIYGEPGAKYSANPPGQEGGLGGPGGGGGAPALGGGFGDDLGDLGEPGVDDMGDIGGTEGAADLGSMGEGGEAPEGGSPLMEGRSLLYEQYIKKLKGLQENSHERVGILNKNFLINEELNSTIKNLENLSKSSENEDIL